ncbi:cilia- and flagella-associated protein 91-like [Porites lutea]|uniref:cilia- and flagella-associated protein 91-like n=1 Tax=Porites lutea TaxID=51062 RepID=UPI003CC62114
MSSTQTVTHGKLQPSRTHDYLYDPLFSLSSDRDHARSTFKAHTGTDRIKRVPHFKTMFSDLRHYPRYSIHLEVTDPVPKFIPRQWRGYAEQNREALIRYTTFNYDPTVQVPPKDYPHVPVSGQDRYKYFRRPIIPFLQQVPPDVLLQSSRLDPLAGPELEAERPPTPATRTVEVQTDYRDSETQTDPYTPEYVVRPGSQPELLTLATLSYGHGLPAGLAEVEMIERARAKRAWEATLPALNDTENLEKRKKMMDEQERREWAFREQEIEKLQEARLEVLKRILEQREEDHAELNTKRLDRLWSNKQQEKEKKFQRIQTEHIKTVRKLNEKRRTVEGKLERRQIVQDYSNYDSQTYAPMSRVGVFLDRGSEQFNVKSYHLNTYQGLLELEASLPDFVTQPRIQAPKPKSSGKGGFVKRKQRRQRELEEVANAIELAKRPPEPEKPLKFLVKVEKPIPRPPTPSVEIPSQFEEEEELALIFLQKVLRGRAIQNMMFEGKEKRLELIQELRSTHALQQAGQMEKRNERQSVLSLQRQRRLDTNKESFVEEALAQMEGSTLADMFDFLSKELIRLQEERRIHAFAMLAERKRRIREAEESGRRQLEERRRREEDEVFKQVVKVHQSTVDTYLEDIIMGAIEQTAEQQARKEIQEQAEKINQIAYDMEKTRTKLQSEEIVAELVSSFLLPEVQKITMRENVKRSQRKHLVAAHRIIYGKTETVMEQQPKVEPSKEEKQPEKQPGVQQETEKPSSAQQVSSRPPSEKRISSRPSSGIKQSSSRPESSRSQKSESGSPKPRSRKSSPKSEQSSRAGSAKSRSSRIGSAKSRPDLSSSRASAGPSNDAENDSDPCP